LIDNLYKKYENKNWPGSILGYIVYKRTYARLKENEDITEEWHETIQRCVSAIKKYNFKISDDELVKLYDYIFNLKCCLSGRALWQLGTKIVDKFMGDSLLNCWFTKLSTIEDFCFGMEELMLGGGVGVSVRKEDVYQLPKIKENINIYREDTKDADFIVPDKREGWVELLKKVLEAFMNNGKSFSYSLDLIRSKGALIKGFGGVSSGPEELHIGIQNICSILKNREGKRLRSIDVLDVFNIIGQIVVSGNVRRSAELAIGDPDDILYLRAKRWDMENVPSWRAMSNNSIAADDYDELMPEFWNSYNGNGEPYGLVNLKLARAVGKLGRKKRDNSIDGANPCVTGDTFITTEIGDIKINKLIKCKNKPKILTFNENNKKLEYNNIRQIELTRKDVNIIKLILEDNTELKLTPNHKVYTENRGWIAANNLSENDIIIQIKNN